MNTNLVPSFDTNFTKRVNVECGANDDPRTAFLPLRLGGGEGRGEVAPFSGGIRRAPELTILFLLFFLTHCAAPTARAQMANPLSACGTNDVLAPVTGNITFDGTAYFTNVFGDCLNPVDYFPSCPSSGASGNGGPSSGAWMTGHYIPPVAQAPAGMNSAADEMAAARAMAAEAAASAGESLSGDGGCCGGSGGGMTHRWPGNPGGPGGPGGPPACCEEGGMAFWWITEPYLNVFLRDKPFFYNTSRGRQVAFELHYKNTAGANGMIDNIQHGIFSAGTNWHLPWRSYLQAAAGTNRYFGFLGDGSARQYQTGQYDPASRATLVSAANNQFHLRFPSGSTNIYGTWITISNNAYCFLSAKVDITGATTTFSYSSNNGTVLLTNVADVDGRNTTFVYTNNGYYSNLLAEIHGPHSLKAYLKYSSQGQLTNIQDVVGLNSGMEYTNGSLARLFTPYGTTAFTYLATNGAQAVRVEEHGLRRHLYLSGFNATNVLPTATNESSELRAFLGNHLGGQSLPETVEQGSFHERNTFYWGPRQYANLPSTIRTALTNGTFNPASLTTNNFKLGWTRHWLRWIPGSGINVYPSALLSLERAPSDSASGATEGLLSWYDYAGKLSDTTAGLRSLPRLAASREPGGEWRLAYTERNELGNPTLVKDRFTVPFLNPDIVNWTWDWRTNALYYAANQVDVISNVFNGSIESSSTYNDFHQILTNKNALDEETTYSYNASRQLTEMAAPSGLILTYTYDGNGFPATVVERTATTGFSTNSYTWSNGRLATSTSERAVTLSYTWDALGRLVKKTWPDNLFVTNIYQNLDLIVTKDRLGFTSGVALNSFRQVLRQTNALGRVTTYSYCNCGSLETATDALSQQTTFTYDNLGRRLRTTLPGGSWSENTYDVLNQATRVTDNASHAVTNSYTLQGLLHQSQTAHGYLSWTEYDAEDRATNTVNANGVGTALDYDVLGRLTRRRPNRWPIDLVGWEEPGEGFFYSARGLVAQSNQLGHFTLFSYDELGRKVAETNANSETTQFKYDLSGNLTNLIDGKQQNTFWRYDEYSRVTNKTDHPGNVVFAYRYDALGRLTSRWTPAKGETTYTNDAAGNLTFINYPVSPDIRLAYDALNRLTNMVDAAGTNRYTYTAWGALLFEDGPWADDTVSYAYTTTRQRQSLSMAQPNAAAWSQTYAYDKAGRMTNTTSPAGAFGYAYKDTQFGFSDGGTFTLPTVGALVERLSLPSGAYIANEFDWLARLTNTTLKNSSHSTLNSHSYQLNDAHQRTRQTRTVAATPSSPSPIDYTYDNIGQLTSALATEYGGTTNRLQEQFRYTYDLAGNLSNRVANVLTNTFSVNSLNELTTVARTTNFTLAGFTTIAASSVTVNGASAARYADNTFAKENLALANGNNTFTAVATDSNGRGDTNAVTLSLPASIAFAYDLNGNMITNGSLVLAYDDENQLVAITNAGAWASTFVYDGKLRRRVRREFEWRNSAWVLTNEVRYVYDGNLVIQERDQFNLPVTAYTRGLDLSGSLQGAGGIGGLLALSQLSTLNPQHFCYHADGNGNVTALIDAAQTVVARYLYDPYGNTLAASGPAAEANLYRFSSKELHAPSSLVYYLYRYYAPDLQRWLNRDPIGEAGGENLYGAIRNAPISNTDPLGLDIGGRAELYGPTPDPVFDPDKWNNENCLAYALNRPCNREMYPGKGDWNDCDNLKQQLQNSYAALPAPTGKCPLGWHKIRVYPGFHVQRQDGDGKWSEKNLGHKARRCKTNSSGVPLDSPEDPGMKAQKPCKGDLCVPN